MTPAPALLTLILIACPPGPPGHCAMVTDSPATMPQCLAELEHDVAHLPPPYLPVLADCHTSTLDPQPPPAPTFPLPTRKPQP